MFKKVCIFICIFTIVLLSFLATAQYYRIVDLERSVDQYRHDIELARRANEQYADTFREAEITNTELGECLSEHVTTLSQLREQLKTVRTKYEQMQSIFENLEDCGDINIGDNCNNDNSGDSH